MRRQNNNDIKKRLKKTNTYTNIMSGLNIVNFGLLGRDAIAGLVDANSRLTPQESPERINATDKGTIIAAYAMTMFITIGVNIFARAKHHDEIAVNADKLNNEGYINDQRKKSVINRSR